jgi:hypothetical protein
VQLGRRWNVECDQAASAEFFELATYLMRNGQASQVMDDCHLLTGEAPDPSSEMVAELIVLIQQARESLITAMG